MDSLGLVELVMEAEKALGVELTDAEANRLAAGTAGDLWRAVVRRRTGAEPPPGAPPVGDLAWREVVRLVAGLTGAPPDDVRWDTPLLGR